MRHLLFILFFSLPCLGNAATLPLASIDANKPSVFQASLETRPSKAGFLKKIAGKVLQKRIYKAAKALGDKKGDDGKKLSIIGLIFGLLGVLLLVIALNSKVAVAITLLSVALLLGLGGLVLCQIGLDHANAMDHPKLWVKVLAYTGLGLNLLLSLAAGGVLFIAVAFYGKQE